MFQHLVARHEMSKRRARFLAAKMVEWRRDRSTLISGLRTMAGQRECNVTGERGYISASPRLARDVSSPTSPLSV
jgi:hypothetical protein